MSNDSKFGKVNIKALTPYEIVTRQRVALILCADHDLYNIIRNATKAPLAAYYAALDSGDTNQIETAKVALTRAELEAYNAAKSQRV